MQKLTYILLLAVSPVLLSALTAMAVSDKSVTPVERSSLLASVTVTSDRPQADGSTHFFTMTMPERTGKRFTKLSFSFTEQNQEKSVAPLRFALASTKAFTGSAKAEGGAIGIKDTWIDETGVLWVEFQSPIPPKAQLTLALKTLQSSPAAAYDYGIAAYPETKFPAVFVGDGSLTVRQ
ncbi:DUF2808 domain-containing protein [Stenomitos frigidus]|uniref:DUF2808 domain-containing protein n=1 Tax=Stenomitos frigidus ULC18 TaxID=2107698 RepID=A0A2T1E6R8_9CYAN|nr:DUF2808 domain-containing protein [Stenomitos frigidus]PSB28374.1 hypothetical protein C7B82_13640 [Stenomitos frigidus ULC18]